MQDFLVTLYNSNPLFLDVEASSGDKFSEIIDLGIVDLDENVLFNSRFKPTVKYFSPYSVEVHGLTYPDLVKEPNFTTKVGKISSILSERYVLCYNASSDLRWLQQTYERYECPLPNMIFCCVANIYRTMNNLKRTIKMQKAAINLDIPEEQGYHNALNGAICASRIFKKIYEQSNRHK